MKIREVAEYYNNLLKIDNFADDPSNNGLQLCGDEERQCCKIAYAVDAALASIEQAVAAGADMLVVHHGLSWGGGIRRWTGDIGRRFQAMFRGNLALYAMHLPLDAHEIYGNNAALADLIKLQDRREFFPYHGMNIGAIGTLQNVDLEDVAQSVSGGLPWKIYSSAGKSHIIRTAAVVSGGAGMDGLLCAVKCGADLLITGEFDHTMYHVVQENNIHVIALGHYNSETYGVRNLQKLAETKLNMQTVFLDIPTGL